MALATCLCAAESYQACGNSPIPCFGPWLQHPRGLKIVSPLLLYWLDLTVRQYSEKRNSPFEYNTTVGGCMLIARQSRRNDTSHLSRDESLPEAYIQNPTNHDLHESVSLTSNIPRMLKTISHVGKEIRSDILFILVVHILLFALYAFVFFSFEISAPSKRHYTSITNTTIRGVCT